MEKTNKLLDAITTEINTLHKMVKNTGSGNDKINSLILDSWVRVMENTQK